MHPPEALRASRQPAAWPLWRSPRADLGPTSPSRGTDLKEKDLSNYGTNVYHQFNSV